MKNLALLQRVGNKALLFNFFLREKEGGTWWEEHRRWDEWDKRSQRHQQVVTKRYEMSAGRSRCPVWFLEEEAAPGAVGLRHAPCKWWVVHHYSGEQDKWEINWTSNHCFWLPMLKINDSLSALIDSYTWLGAPVLIYRSLHQSGWKVLLPLTLFVQQTSFSLGQPTYKPFFSLWLFTLPLRGWWFLSLIWCFLILFLISRGA